MYSQFMMHGQKNIKLYPANVTKTSVLFNIQLLPFSESSSLHSFSQETPVFVTKYLYTAVSSTETIVWLCVKIKFVQYLRPTTKRW